LNGKKQKPYGIVLKGCNEVLHPCVKENKSRKEFIVSEELASRDPEPSDLVKICKALNEQGVKYVVIGGMAMVLHGFNRGTEDIDLLVDKVASNISLLKKALSILPDNAIRDVLDSDVEKYEVVRVADEVVVDLMGSACGIDFKSAESQIEWHELEGVKIPFASAELMLKTKQTLREKDEIDRLYLRRILGKL
jgi:predicted nucleotidyltransferase